MTDLSREHHAVDTSGPLSADELLPLVYDELRKLAAARLAHEDPGQTLQPTALVHEAYLRLVGDGNGLAWDNRSHFFAAAAEAMRRILIENARRRGAVKHGGGKQRVELDAGNPAPCADPDELLDLDTAIETLALEDADAARVVKLRLYAGLSVEEAAAALGVSRSAAYEHWAYGRAWLSAHLRETKPPNA